jgi:hypothetical protein
MYENWKFERWETPISNERFVSMISLVDDGDRLSVVVGSLPGRKDVQFIFTEYPAYRNIQELYRTELWSKLSEKEELGNTFIIPQSQWLASLKYEGLEIYFPNIVHYMICTEFGCVEVLSGTAPEIKEIEASSNEAF